MQTALHAYHSTKNEFNLFYKSSLLLQHVRQGHHSSTNQHVKPILLKIQLYFALIFTDKLTKNLVTEAISRDKKENVNKAHRDQTTTHLNNLVKAICSCGVSFGVWEKQNVDGRGSGLFDFTSLMGTDKKLLLQKLPAKLNGIISPATSNTVIKIWQVFVKNIRCNI